MKRCKCGEWTASSQNGICDLCCAKERTAYEQKKIAEAVAVARAGALEEAARVAEDTSRADSEYGTEEHGTAVVIEGEIIASAIRALAKGRGSHERY
jgi:hypothetical protein